MQASNLFRMGCISAGKLDDRHRPLRPLEGDEIGDAGMLLVVPADAIVGIKKDEVGGIQVCRHRLDPFVACRGCDRGAMKMGPGGPKIRAL